MRSISARGGGAERRSRLALMLSGIIAAASGCVLESNRCGPNAEIYAGAQTERCVCVANAAYTPTGCVLCGDNETPGATGCVCAVGFVRNAQNACEALVCGENEVPGATACECAGGYIRNAQGACELMPAGQGSLCSTTMPCTDATFNHCATSANGMGYCTTTGCTGNTECTNGYACDMSGTPSYCKRPPVGAGMSCTSSADCAGTEATFCDTFVQHACIVEGCTVSPNSCFSGTECCAIPGIPMPICIPAGACTT